MSPTTETPQRPRVLVVEDDTRIQRMLQSVLESEQYGVETVGDGRTALEAIEREAPSMIILDLMLPDIDGWEVMSRLRARKETEDLPVLVLSAVHDIARESLRIGANDFLRKPFGLDALLDKVGRLSSGPQAAPAAGG